jgi:hypothetical protein
MSLSRVVGGAGRLALGWGTVAFLVAGLASAVLSPGAVAAGDLSLSSFGGPVLHSSAPYLVFWTPSGQGIPARSRSLMRRYFTDVAAASGTSSNVFGVLRQYYDRTGFADYRQTFDPRRQVIVDPRPYPPRDPTACPYDSTYPTCVSDAQIRSELQRLITADGLPTAGPERAAFPGQGSQFPSVGANPIAGRLSANAPIYFVVLPANVEFCYLLATHCSDWPFWGYHLSFTDTQGNIVLYAAIAMDPERGIAYHPPFASPCDPGGTGVAQEPNNDPGDCAISRLSHEDSEAITDPLDDGDIGHSAWFTLVTGNNYTESGDPCEVRWAFDPATGSNPDAYAPTLGGNAAAGTLYTQLINGHRYYTQSEWSNGAGNCAMRPSPGRIVPRFTAPGKPARAGVTLRFNATGSASKYGYSSATWRFGDGSPTAFYSGSAALTPATHAYARAGRYTVRLTLVDNRGNLRTTTRHVIVHRPKEEPR